MESFGLYIFTAIALIFVIEGLLYALFPDMMRKMMMSALSLPPATLRNFGIAMVIIGFALVSLGQLLF
ncbi:MAG: DUF2065 domain-containing protein [Alphaproteobacteria bacterium]